MTLSLSVINLPQLHIRRHQGHAALDTVLLFVTAENFLQCHPWSRDMQEKVSICFFPLTSNTSSPTCNSENICW